MDHNCCSKDHNRGHNQEAGIQEAGIQEEARSQED